MPDDTRRKKRGGRVSPKSPFNLTVFAARFAVYTMRARWFFEIGSFQRNGEVFLFFVSAVTPDKKRKFNEICC
jgi:hypothetical protein